MTILAIEFSCAQRSVAVLSGPDHNAQRVESEAVDASSVSGGFSERTGSFGLIESALRDAGLAREQIMTVAIGLGPGSYTGIRMALAVAQGWQLVREVKLLGISSAQCIAAEAQRHGLRGPVTVIIDAQRSEFYAATYRISETGLSETSPLAIYSPQSFPETGSIKAGPDVKKWFPNGTLIFPRARTIARLAAGRSDFIEGPGLEPIYLRETAFVKARTVSTIR